MTFKIQRQSKILIAGILLVVATTAARDAKSSSVTNQTGIVNLTGIDRSTVGEVIGRLVRRGWLRRRRTTTDGRSNSLYVTVAGNRLLKRVVLKVDVAQERILAPIPPDRREEFISNLRLIAYSPLFDGNDSKDDLE